MSRYVRWHVCVYDPECNKTGDDGEFTRKKRFRHRCWLACLVATCYRGLKSETEAFLLPQTHSPCMFVIQNRAFIRPDCIKSLQHFCFSFVCLAGAAVSGFSGSPHAFINELHDRALPPSLQRWNNSASRPGNEASALKNGTLHRFA